MVNIPEARHALCNARDEKSFVGELIEPLKARCRADLGQQRSIDIRMAEQVLQEGRVEDPYQRCRLEDATRLAKWFSEFEKSNL